MPWTNPSILMASLLAQQGLINSGELFLANRKVGGEQLTQKVHPCQRMERCSSWAEPHLKSQVFNQITFFFFFFSLGTQVEYLIWWNCFHFCLQSDTGTAWIHVMNERMIATVTDQQQCTSHFRHNYAVVSKKREDIGHGVWIFLFTQVSLNVSFLLFNCDSAIQLWDFEWPV